MLCLCCTYSVGGQSCSDAFPLPRPLKRTAGVSETKPATKGNKTTDNNSSNKDGSSGVISPTGAAAETPTAAAEAAPTAAAVAAPTAAAAVAAPTRKGPTAAPRAAEDRGRDSFHNERRRREPEGPFSPSFFEPKILKDSDRQLAYLAQILKGIHFLYFRAVGRLIRAHRAPTAPNKNRNCNSNKANDRATSSCSSSSATSSSGEDGDEAPSSTNSRECASSSSSSSKAAKSGVAFCGGTAAIRAGRCRVKNRLKEKDSCPLALSVLENLPDVSWVLQAFRQQALQGSLCFVYFVVCGSLCVYVFCLWM